MFQAIRRGALLAASVGATSVAATVGATTVAAAAATGAAALSAAAPNGLGADHPPTCIVKGDGKPAITLEYFAIRALGELPRLILEVTGLPYTNVFHYAQGTWKAYAPFGQLPLLRDGDLLLSESGAIARHLARRACIDGATLEDKAKVDMYYELSKDIKDKKAAVYDLANHADAAKLRQFLGCAEAACDGAHFVGGTLTLADVAMFEQLYWLTMVAPGSLDQYPKLHAFTKAFAAQPSMVEYLDSPRRVPLTHNELGKERKPGYEGYVFLTPPRVAMYATTWEGP